MVMNPGLYDYVDGVLQRQSGPISPIRKGQYTYWGPPEQPADGLYPMPGAQAVQGADGLYPMPGAQAVQGVDGLYPMQADPLNPVAHNLAIMANQAQMAGPSIPGLSLIHI